MARPAKYNWDKIKIDYESGLTQAEIHKKHEVPYNRLSERCKEWEISEQAKAVIKGFIAKVPVKHDFKRSLGRRHGQFISSKGRAMTSVRKSCPKGGLGKHGTNWHPIGQTFG